MLGNLAREFIAIPTIGHIVKKPQAAVFSATKTVMKVAAVAVLLVATVIVLYVAF